MREAIKAAVFFSLCGNLTLNGPRQPHTHTHTQNQTNYSLSFLFCPFHSAPLFNSHQEHSKRGWWVCEEQYSGRERFGVVVVGGGDFPKVAQ